MAQVLTQASSKFTSLFNNPTVEGMYALTPKEFEHFVAYVLHRAGFDAKVVGPHFLHGVDVEMRLPGKTRIVGGVECKRFASDQQVSASVVQHVKGASAVSKPGAKPFVFTTSDFNAAAYKMAVQGNKHAYLVNGAQLVRYITYVRGSGNDDEDVITTLPPEYFAGHQIASQKCAASTYILTVANNKGGVGKTTTAYYLGVELARRGKRVLLIDLDAQANLTERCIPEQVTKHIEEGQSLPSIASYFANQSPLTDRIIACDMHGLCVIPSDPLLSLRDVGGSGRPDIEMRFVRDVEKLCAHSVADLGGTPEWIIIDTPPSMSVFTRAGLAAAHYVLAPIRPRRSSMQGTKNMLDTMQTMNALTGTPTRFLGAVVTHWDNLALSAFFMDVTLPLALAGVGGKVFDARIPMDNQLDNLEPGAKTQGAKAYDALATEVLNAV